MIVGSWSRPNGSSACLWCRPHLCIGSSANGASTYSQHGFGGHSARRHLINWYSYPHPSLELNDDQKLELGSLVEIQWVYVSSVGEWPERQIEDFLVKQLAGAEEEAAAEQNIDEEDE